MNRNNNQTTPFAHNTPLFQAVYKLYLAWYRRCQTIPKKDRFTIGQKAENTLLEIMTLVVSAYHTKDSVRKREILSQINIKVEGIKILFRLAKDVKAIEQRPYIDYESRLQEIGKMLGGWMRQTQSPSIR